MFPSQSGPMRYVSKVPTAGEMVRWRSSDNLLMGALKKICAVYPPAPAPIPKAPYLWNGKLYALPRSSGCVAVTRGDGAERKRQRTAFPRTARLFDARAEAATFATYGSAESSETLG